MSGVNPLFTSGAQVHTSDQQNPTSLRGVSYEKRKGVWRARLYCKGRHIPLGRFRDAESAARAHDHAAVFVFGDRAVTNLGIASARVQLERLSVERTFRNWRLFRKLTALREAVRKDQQGMHLIPDECRARAMRQVAAAFAISFCDVQMHSKSTKRAGHALGRSVSARFSLVRRNQRDEVDAPWKALVLAAMHL